MRPVSRLIAFAVLAGFAGLFPPSAAAQDRVAELLVGHWYGRDTSADGRERRWIIDRRKDGTERILFRWYGGTSTRENELVTEGVWSHQGGVYYSTYLTLNGKPNENPERNAYAIVTLNESDFVYRSHSNDIVYSVKRVDATFQLPPP